MSNSLFNAFKGYAQAQNEQRAGKQIKHARRPAVTISREAGAGGLPVAQLVAEELQRHHPDQPWVVFDRNLAERVIEDHQLPGMLKQFMAEDVTSGVTSAVEELLGLHPSQWELVQHTTDTILRLANLGNVVIVGRGANFVTTHLKNVFHVRLVAPFEQRVRQQAEELHISKAEAEQLIAKTDRARQRYVSSHFGAKIDNPFFYHIIINTGMTSIPTAVRLIVEGVLSLKF